MTLTENEIERFKIKLKTIGECLEFVGSRNTEGYGNFWAGGRCRKAHRVAWTIAYGIIPFDVLVLHKCDNPPCCEPSHLFLGSDKDNTLDKVQKGRMYPTHEHYNPSVVLLREQVFEIHRLLIEGILTQQDIADKYDITKGHVNNIKAGRAWPEVRKEFYNGI